MYMNVFVNSIYLSIYLYRLAQHVTYVHQNSKQPPSQFTPLDTKLMTLVLVNLHVYLCVYKCIYCMCGNCKHLCLPCTCILSLYMYMYTLPSTCILSLYLYMKIHVPSMLAVGVDKHTQQTNKQPQWLH